MGVDVEMLAAVAGKVEFPDRILLSPRGYHHIVHHSRVLPPADGSTMPFHGTPVVIDNKVRSFAFQRRCECRALSYVMPVGAAPCDLIFDRDGRCTKCNGEGFVTYYEPDVS